MTTGPHDTRFQIPQITLGDTFNEWRNTTNDSIIDKLNRMSIYTAASGDGINVSMGTDGQAVFQHSGHVSTGVTFSGPVTFNGTYTVVNAQEFSIDDYIIMLGATGANSTGPSGGLGATDNIIENVGGGGLQILRSEGATASLVWKPTIAGGTGAGGVTGMWWVEGPHIGLTTDAWIVPLDQSIRMQTSGVGASAEGLIFTQGSSEGEIKMQMQITSGEAYDTINFNEYDGSQVYTNIVNGVNRRRISRQNHGFSVGMVVRYDSAGWTFGKSDSDVNAEGVAVVANVVGSNTADIIYNGELVADFRDATTDGATLMPGSAYFLDWSNGGKLRTEPPTDAGQINKPILVALDNITSLGPSGDRALIVNYRGALVPDEANDITVHQNNKFLITQVNDFVIGDLIRFEPDEHYGWSGTAGSTGEVGEAQYYANGVWRRGQANTEEEAEVIAVVIDTEVAGDPNKFFASLNGKVTLSDNPAYNPLEPGRVYFLSANSAPNGEGGLNNSAESLVLDVPLTVGHVKKPWGIAVSTTEMIIVNYKGNVIGVGGGCNGGGGSCVVEAGRNLLINGNFDYWQRLSGYNEDGSSADIFTAGNANALAKGGPHESHTSATNPSQRFLADRWGLVMHDGYDLDGNSTHDGSAVVWNADADYGEVTRQNFSLADDGGLLANSKSKKAKHYLRLTTNQDYVDAGGKASPAIEQRIEGVDSLYNDYGTLTFWARRSAGTQSTLGGVQVSLTQRIAGTGEYRNDVSSSGASSRYCVTPNKVVSSPVFGLNSTWTKYTYTFDVPNIVGVSAGTVAGFATPPSSWDSNVNSAKPNEGFLGLMFQPQIDDWEITPPTGATGWVGSFDIAQVQFEQGATETDFDIISLNDELKRCQRYYQKSYETQYAPGFVDTPIGMVKMPDQQINDTWQLVQDYKTIMCHRPTIDVYSIQGTKNMINGISESFSSWGIEMSAYGFDSFRVLDNPYYGGGVGVEGFMSVAGYDPDGNSLWNEQEEGHNLMGHFRCHYVADAEI